ncbi:MAG: RnfABCDGE type electron transport complex subunit D [Deltaproteobacteria bacterium]|nr:RnfABCDGE type electron transport complex subunit D [Deltaproteobacteria bacterium]
MTTLIKTKSEAASELSDLSVSVSPHVKSGESVEKIMWTVVACLLPPLILSVMIFGLRSLLITMIGVGSCVTTEAVSQRLLRKPVRIRDGSAVITGMLLAYVIPPGVPLWMPIPGAFMAIFVTKILMGGIGFNIFNPALIGRAFLMAGYPVAMTSAWVFPSRVDAISTATPLYVMKHYGISGLVEKFGPLSSIRHDFFLGIQPGCIGETSALLILAGGLFLLFKGYVTWHIPVSVLGSIGFFTWVFGGEAMFSGPPLLAILSGGAMLGAFFMATDYVTSPNNRTGKIIFGVGIGALTVLIRLRGGYPEGVCYAVLLMNPLTPTLDRWFKPKRFGTRVS